MTENAEAETVWDGVEDAIIMLADALACIGEDAVTEQGGAGVTYFKVYVHFDAFVKEFMEFRDAFAKQGGGE